MNTLKNSNNGEKHLGIWHLSGREAFHTYIFMLFILIKGTYSLSKIKLPECLRKNKIREDNYVKLISIPWKCNWLAYAGEDTPIHGENHAL